MQLQELTQDCYQYWQSVYLAAFPPYERIDFDDLIRLAQANQMIKLNTLIEDEQPVGIVLNIELNHQKSFILYFAIDESKRSGGLGSKALNALKSAYPGGIILESELTGSDVPNEEQRVRRYRFYQKNGLIDTKYITENLGGTFHLLASTSEITVADYEMASSQIGIETHVVDTQID